MPSKTRVVVKKEFIFIRKATMMMSRSKMMRAKVDLTSALVFGVILMQLVATSDALARGIRAHVNASNDEFIPRVLVEGEAYNDPHTKLPRTSNRGKAMKVKRSTKKKKDKKYYKLGSKKKSKKQTKSPADVAVLFVGHGEPRSVQDGYKPITLADGTSFGPHGESIGVPEEFQNTEWAAAYEEIATAMTYIFPDLNGNGIKHEVGLVPDGDVPKFFSWSAFRKMVSEHYEAVNDYSPHNDALMEHVHSLDIQVCGVKVDKHLAFLDAVPRIRDLAVDIAKTKKYYAVFVTPMLLADSTHTEEVQELVKESAHLMGDMKVVVGEPFYEVPYMQRRFRNAAISMAKYVREAIPAEVPDHNIGVVLASHGSPYVPAREEFGWEKGDIFSNLIPTEDAHHAEICMNLQWMCRTGRMKYSTPTIEQALDDLDANGIAHVMVIPTAFPTSAIHTMWDVANSAVGRAVLPEEGVVTNTRLSGMTVYYTAEGLADIEPGRSGFQKGLEFQATTGVIEVMNEDGDDDDDFTPYVACQQGDLCVTVSASEPMVNMLMQFMFYKTTEDDWPDKFMVLSAPDWVIKNPPIPDRNPARFRIPLQDNLLSIMGHTLEGVTLGLVVAISEGMPIKPDDPVGYSSTTLDYQDGGGMDFGKIHVTAPEGMCLPGEICVTVTALQTTGSDLKMLLYPTTENDWPVKYRDVPTPTWVVTETTSVPDTFPIHIRIQLLDNLYAFTNELLEGARLGLVVVTGVASNFVVDPSDARGFSAMTHVYESGASLDFGNVELTVPQELCLLNPYNAKCMTGPLLWREHLLGEPNFVPGAIYLDVSDLDGDGILDLVMTGEPHFENPDLPLTELKLGIYYLNKDRSVRKTEIVDQWSEADPTLYSPWGVKVIDHGGSKMIIVGLNIPGLAPLEEGNGNILSYRRVNETWERSVIMNNTNPNVTDYNAMIIVAADIDNDGDQDLALSGAFKTSSVGSWMENTGKDDVPWIPHLQPMDPSTSPNIRGTLCYKSADLNGDGYPELVYNAMFDIPGTDPPQYHGEIWLAVNPGNNTKDWTEPWEMIVIDDDNWASADMWFHDFDNDTHLDLVANQIFDSTVTLYRHPGDNLSDQWQQHVIVSGLASPSDMWLADMDGDSLMDVVSADHTAHRGVWHRNPGPGQNQLWHINMIFPSILLPGDFAMVDIDEDGDLDWVGTSVTEGQGFIVEQIQPSSSLITTMSVPNDFSGTISSLLLALVKTIQATGPPDKVLATIKNVDNDGDGVGDVDQILGPNNDFVLATNDVGLNGDYYVMAILYMEGGGVFQPVSGVDYMAISPVLTFGQGQVKVTLIFELYASSF